MKKNPGRADRRKEQFKRTSHPDDNSNKKHVMKTKDGMAYSGTPSRFLGARKKYEALQKKGSK